jgi:DNA replication protein DnaC
MLTVSAPIEAKSTAAVYSIAPKKSTQEIIDYFVSQLKRSNLSQELSDKLTAINWNIDVYAKIAAYASNDVESMAKYGIDPNKGILLMGPIGCGKTEVMMLLRSIIKPGFKVENIFDIMLGFNTKGDAVLIPFRKGPILSSTQKQIYCFFDDLGVERTGSYFGTKAEIGIDLIYMRHLNFKETGAKSYFTTNMNVDEITNNYKDISRSRLREMCNVIQFSKNAPDLRA